MTSKYKQRGSTLLVALIMLVLLTLIAVSALSSTTASIQVVGNAQVREEASSVGQRAMEAVISSNTFKTVVPVAQTFDVNRDGTADYTVTFDNPAPVCNSAQVVQSGTAGVPDDCIVSANGKPPVPQCYWTEWDVTANVSDISTGSSVILHQGVRSLTGMNTVLDACGIIN